MDSLESPLLSVLANRTYRHLFCAQVIALVGTGLATVALGLLAYDIAGGNAGAVLGTALAIKMIAQCPNLTGDRSMKSVHAAISFSICSTRLGSRHFKRG